MNWPALARRIVARRVQLGIDTQKALAEASRISLRIISDLEAGKRDSYSISTIARLEAALEWPQGRVDEILRATDDQLHPVVPSDAREPLHPLAMRLHRVLTDTDIVPERDRDVVETVVDRILDPVEREYFRVASVSFDPQGDPRER